MYVKMQVDRVARYRMIHFDVKTFRIVIGFWLIEELSIQSSNL
jgi:hypothetical protein